MRTFLLYGCVEVPLPCFLLLISPRRCYYCRVKHRISTKNLYENAFLQVFKKLVLFFGTCNLLSVPFLRNTFDREVEKITYKKRGVYELVVRPHVESIEEMLASTNANLPHDKALVSSITTVLRQKPLQLIREVSVRRAWIVIFCCHPQS